jgi:hypothetical protein
LHFVTGMDLLATLGRTVGFSLAAGVNLYATVAILGLAAKYDRVHDCPVGPQMVCSPRHGHGNVNTNREPRTQKGERRCGSEATA